MGAALDVVQQGYAAFARQDIPALMKLVADDVDWEEICPTSLPYSGLRRTPAEVGAFFADIAKVEEVTVFEPKEFIEAGENVTVFGYLEAFALDTKQKFQTEWVHVFRLMPMRCCRTTSFAAIFLHDYDHLRFTAHGAVESESAARPGVEEPLRSRRSFKKIDARA